MAKDHGSSVKDDKQYEGLRKRGMSKQRAASIANSPKSSQKKGGKKVSTSTESSDDERRSIWRFAALGLLLCSEAASSRMT